jgi:two-component system sensor histidine kinase PilS (NtrC family)
MRKGSNRVYEFQVQPVTSAYHWQALRLFNLYRVFLALGFLAFLKSPFEINFFGGLDELLYYQTSVFYIFISLFFLFCSVIFKFKYEWQANAPIFIDVVTIIVLMHASGGIISGVGILLIVIAAAHSLLAPGRLSSLSAACSAIGLFFEHSYSFLAQDIGIKMYTQVGLLGSVILATSFVTNWLSIRARRSQMIVESQAQLLATSQQLNAHIVWAMHDGVLVLDNELQIRLINTAATKLLDLQEKNNIRHLNDLPQTFQDCFREWQHHGKQIFSKSMNESNTEVRLSFHPLGKGLPAGILIFIYDVAEETRHAQDLKLASLGHLTANIAHELRNPLGAASHAAQLLAESFQMSSEDQDLVKMIKQSCDRMNTVIKNVLSLSGRTPAKTQRIALIPWLEQFCDELVIPNIPQPEVNLQYQNTDLYVDIDPSQLTQILINLCENGLRYSLRKNGKATVTLRVLKDKASSAIFLDIIDQGEGLSGHIINHVFEPFFTTEKTGSGLGLYIARELSQMNGARLDFCENPNGGQFRITLPQGDML